MGQMSDEPRRDQSAPDARERLLDAVVEHFTTDGLADQSLRRIAEATGTSHRMLLYHFGSKEGLLLAVVQSVEARTRAMVAAIAAGLGTVRDAGASPDTGADTDAGRDAGAGPDAPTVAPDELIRRVWSYVADPALAGFERLFFALYTRALQGDTAARPLLDDDIEVWLEANATLASTGGVPATVARTHGRLGLAVVRGLLLDLLATGDRAGVDAALELFARGYAGRPWDFATAGPADVHPPAGSSTTTSDRAS
jgi:AcrR family transcriptional regulator